MAKSPEQRAQPSTDRRYINLDGDCVRDLRARKFGSQSAFATKVGVAEHTIASAEKGYAILRSTALAIAGALQVDLRALLPRHVVQHSPQAAEAGFTGWDPFADILEEKTKDFVGREYVISAIDAFVAQESPGYCFVEGDPGMGKTSLLAEWIRRTSCIAFFNVRSMGLNRASQFLNSICHQIIDRFGLSLTGLPPEATQDGSFLLKLLQRTSDQPDRRGKIVIAVDALDEVDMSGQSAGSNVLYLPQWLPQDVYFVMTRRRQTGMPFVAQARQHTIDLLSYPDQSRRDILTYIQTAVAATPELQAWIRRAHLREDQFAAALADKSERNFMYVHYVLPELTTGTYRNLTIDKLPAGLEGYYYDHWRVMGMMDRPLNRSKLNVLYVLAEVREPVSRRLIADFTKVDEVTVQSILDEWGQFLHRTQVEDDGSVSTRHSVYHTSFRDFLHRQDVITAADLTLPQVHGMIADSLWNKVFPGDSETL